MRISPIVLSGEDSLDKFLFWAEQDAKITHPNPICIEANKLFVASLALGVYTNLDPRQIYLKVLANAKKEKMNTTLISALEKAQTEQPRDFFTNMGWVVIALQNAFFHFLNSNSWKDAIVETISKGGDTDTNASICGALLGSVYGVEAIPQDWIKTVLSCQPDEQSRSRFPRPSWLWPTHTLSLIEEAFIM